MRLHLVTLGLLALAGAHSVTAADDTSTTIGGDFRYRHELIDTDGAEMRNRQRIRARVNLTSKLSDRLVLRLQAASGSDDPISTNQTLSGGFSSKGINLDEAYVAWSPSRADGITLTGGKAKNPFVSPGKTELIWDGDLRPEGISAGYDGNFDGVRLFANTAYYWVAERSSANDAVLLGAQAGLGLDAGPAGILFGAGYYDYQNARGNATFYDNADSFGNSVDVSGGYAFGYKDVELFMELRPSASVPFSVFADYVTNIAEDVEDGTGWLAGFSLGKSGGERSYDLRYSYRSVERDAVVGAFSDSDFIGGGTDGSGHEINFSCQVTRKVKAELSYFHNQRGLDNGRDYNRLQMDVNFKL